MPIIGIKLIDYLSQPMYICIVDTLIFNLSPFLILTVIWIKGHNRR